MILKLYNARANYRRLKQKGGGNQKPAATDKKAKR